MGRTDLGRLQEGDQGLGHSGPLHWPRWGIQRNLDGVDRGADHSGRLGDFIVVAGNNEDGSPVPLSITAEVVKDRDGESVWHKGGEPKNLPAAGSTGSAVIRTGKTRSAFAVPKRSKSRMASGTGWR